MTTRLEKKEQRRQEILINALGLFVAKGYADTKIADIATASGMSMGLLFHYFESKEQLYRELVRMGAEGTNIPQTLEFTSPVDYFKGFLDVLFQYAKEQPWIFQMFVLMMQARSNTSLPEDIRALAMGINQGEISAKVITEGQQQGLFREGNPYVLSFAFWSSVQGVMEQLAVTPEIPLPETEWLLDILRGEKG